MLRTAELLHRHGTPSYRLERVMTKVSQSLGIDSTYLYTPTALLVSIVRDGEERTYLRRVDSGEVDVSKLLAFDAVLGDLETGRISIDQATQRLEEASTAPPPYRSATTIAAAGVACGTVAVIFGGGVGEVGVAALLGLWLAWFGLLTGQLNWERGLLEPLAGFAVAIFSLLASYAIPLDHRLTTLAALILLLPGLTLTIALTELALGHLSAGSARFAGASVTLLTLVFGVGLAWRLGPSGLPLPGPVEIAASERLPIVALWISLALAPAAFAILFRAPLSQWPVIFAVSISGFALTTWLGKAVAPEVGSFCGALVVGCGGNLYARIKNRPAMVAQTPGLLILVPGSIGYRSLTAMLESHTVEGIALGFTMALIAMSLVAGLLSANLILPPKRIL